MKGNKFLLLALFSACALYIADAAKMLVVIPMPSKSHTLLGEGLVRNLLQDGHEVTYITTFPMKETSPKLKQIETSSLMDAIPKDFSIKNIMDGKYSFGSILDLSFMMHYITKGSMEHENVQKFINDPKQEFDLVIVEYMFNTMYSGLAQVYKCPLIWMVSVEPHSMSLELVDEMSSPAYVPEVIFSDLPPLNFWQRANQLLFQIKHVVFQFFFKILFDQRLYQTVFGPICEKKGIQLAPLSVAEKNGSLVLSNSHISLGQATRLPQNYIPIGGYHINNKTSPLPDDLKKIIEGSKYGVIYFSMGSNLKSKDLPDEVKTGLLKIFGELKQTVLWKFEENLNNVPKNVHILKWAPQPSILAHPNCKLFITHGGLLSTTETVHFGVPIIGIPTFADQFINVKRAVKRGYAIEVPLNYDLAKNLKAAIDLAVSDPSYAKTAKVLSSLYHDRQNLPGETLKYWVNHVIRTGGAPHLRSPALTAAWYQKMYLDLLALILAVLYVVKKVVSKFRSKKQKKQKVN